MLKNTLKRWSLKGYAMNSTDNLETLPLPTEEEHGFEEYTFMGMDGETYKVGKTPLTFLTDMREFFNPDIEMLQDIDVKTVAKWMWQHMRSVEGQRHLTQDDVEQLLFLADLPVYFTMIFRRSAEAQLEQNKFKQTVEQIPKDIKRINSMIDNNNRYYAARKVWEETNGLNTKGEQRSDIQQADILTDHSTDGKDSQEGLCGTGEPDITVLSESISPN